MRPEAGSEHLDLIDLRTSLAVQGTHQNLLLAIDRGQQKPAAAIERDPATEVVVDVAKQEIRFGGQSVKASIREAAHFRAGLDAVAAIVDALGGVHPGGSLPEPIEAGLDLVEVAAAADPPVCRIMDYGKFKYEQSKREKESRKGAKHSELREVRMRVKIDDHDIDFKARTARKLLADGDKVKVTLRFRGREMAHQEIGMRVLERIKAELEQQAVVEHPAGDGRGIEHIIPVHVGGGGGGQSAPTTQTVNQVQIPPELMPPFNDNSRI